MNEQDKEAQGRFFKKLKRKKSGLRIRAMGTLPKDEGKLRDQLDRVFMKHHGVTPEELEAMGEDEIEM